MKKKKSFQKRCLWTLPSSTLLLCLTIAPLVMLVLFSFMNRNLFPGQEWPGWTSGNYVRMFTSATYWKLLLKSLRIALEVTVICIIAGYPAAWAIAKVVKEKYRSIFMMVVILPFFTSQLLLIYSMMNLIQTGGLLLTLLDSLGLHDVKSIMYTEKATVLILVYEFLPYMILCLYSSLEGINDNIIHASSILGAGKLRTFVNIVFPMSVPGLLSGVLLVFVPVAGCFAEPNLVGGSYGMMVGSMINTQYKDNLNMGYGAVLALALLIILCLIMALISALMKKAQTAIGGEVE